MRVLCLILAFVALEAQATVGVVHDLATMTRRSEVVVQAKVVKQTVTQDAKGRIITLSTLRVQDGLKGSRAGQELTLYQVGGELNGRVMRLQGASVYRPGEEIVLFAAPFQDKIVSYGLGLGKFNIVKDHSGTQVIEDIHDIEVVQRKNGIQFYAQPEARRYPSLQAFKAEIRKAI